MSELINTIDKLGDDVVAISILDKTIIEFNDDFLTRMGEYAFHSCKQLISVNLPNVTKLDDGGCQFYYCSKLKTVNLPMVSTIPKSCFQGCAGLESIKCDNATQIGDNGFWDCEMLISIDLPSVTSIGSQTFQGSEKLEKIILRSTTICALGNTSVFNFTPFAAGGTGGTVYVPQALIEQYQTETNWSTLYAAGTCNFVAIEGSEYE